MSREDDFKVGLRVSVAGKTGTVAFTGTVDFASGFWLGIILDEDAGKNNGTVQGKAYFECKDKHGIFVRCNNATILDQQGSTEPKAKAKVGAKVKAKADAKAKPKGDAKVKAKPKSSSSQEPVPSEPLPPTPEPVVADEGPPAAGATDEAPTAAPPSPEPSPVEVEPAAAEDPTTKAQPSVQPAAKAAPDALQAKADELRSEIEELQRQRGEQLIKLREDEKKQAKLEEAEANNPTMKRLREVESSVHNHKVIIQRLKEETVVLKDISNLRHGCSGEEGAVDDLKKLQELLKTAMLQRELAEAKVQKLQIQLEEVQVELDLGLSKNANRMCGGDGQKDLGLSPELAKELAKLGKAAPADGNAPDPLDAFVADGSGDAAAPTDTDAPPLPKIELCQKAKEYQMALVALKIGAMDAIKQMESKIRVLKKDKDKNSTTMKAEVEKFHRDHQSTQEKLALVQLHAKEIEDVVEAGKAIDEINDNIVKELQDELKAETNRVEELEKLVKTMREEREVMEQEIKEFSGKAGSVLQQVLDSMRGNQGSGSWEATQVKIGEKLMFRAHSAAAAMKMCIGDLDTRSVSMFADAFSVCLPNVWLPSRESVTRVSCRVDRVGALESVLYKAESVAVLVPSIHLCGREQEEEQMHKLMQICTAHATLVEAADATLEAVWLLPEEQSELELQQVDTTRVDEIVEEILRLAYGVEARGDKTLKQTRFNTLAELFEEMKACANKMSDARIACSTHEPPVTRMKVMMALRRIEAAVRVGVSVAGPRIAKLADSIAEHKKAAEKADNRIEFAPEEGAKDAKPDDNKTYYTNLRDEEQRLQAEDEAKLAVLTAFAKEWPPLVENITAFAKTLRKIEMMPFDPLADLDSGSDDEEQEKLAVPEDFAAALTTLDELVMTEKSPDEHEPTRSDLLFGCLQDIWNPIAAGVATFEKCKLLRKQSFGRKRCSPWQSSFVIVDPPGWAHASVHVLKEVDSVYDKQREANAAKHEETMQQGILDQLKNEQTAISSRRSLLLDDYKEKESRCKGVQELGERFESLREKAHSNSEELAKLRMGLELARSARESQETLLSEISGKTGEITSALETIKQRPATEFEGRATAQELAALERSIAKGARELYALQLDTVEELRPLVPPKPAPQKASKLKVCMERYADLRRELIHEWARPRLTRLDDFKTQRDVAGEHSAEAIKDAGISESVPAPLVYELQKLQQLQQKIAGIKAAAQHEIDAGNAKGEPASKLDRAGGNVAHVKLTVPVPKWLGLKKHKEDLQVSHRELQRLHRSLI